MKLPSPSQTRLSAYNINRVVFVSHSVSPVTHKHRFKTLFGKKQIMLLRALKKALIPLVRHKHFLQYDVLIAYTSMHSTGTSH